MLTVVSFVCLFHYCLSLPFNVDVCGVLYTYWQISSPDSITLKISICYLLLLLLFFLSAALPPLLPHITLTPATWAFLWFTAQFSDNFWIRAINISFGDLQLWCWWTKKRRKKTNTFYATKPSATWYIFLNSIVRFLLSRLCIAVLWQWDNKSRGFDCSFLCTFLFGIVIAHTSQNICGFNLIMVLEMNIRFIDIVWNIKNMCFTVSWALLSLNVFRSNEKSIRKSLFHNQRFIFNLKTSKRFFIQFVTNN